MVTGPWNQPASRTQWQPVNSPLPFKAKVPAQTGCIRCSGARGKMAVTPVRMVLPASSAIRVEYPTRTPGTSVMAFQGPGVPGIGSPSSRARFLAIPGLLLPVGKSQHGIGSRSVDHEASHVGCRVALLVERISEPQSRGFVLIVGQP